MQGAGASVLISDDPDESEGWVDATGSGVLRWEWGSCCSDGMVFGPLPTDTFCLNVRYSIPVEWLSKLRLFDYTDDTDTISNTEFGVDTMESGIQVCPWQSFFLNRQGSLWTRPSPFDPLSLSVHGSQAGLSRRLTKQERSQPENKHRLRKSLDNEDIFKEGFE